MQKSDLSEIIEFFEKMAKRAQFLADEKDKSLEEIAAATGIDLKLETEALPLFNTPEEALQNAENPVPKIMADGLAKFIVEGGGQNG